GETPPPVERVDREELVISFRDQDADAAARRQIGKRDARPPRDADRRRSAEHQRQNRSRESPSPAPAPAARCGAWGWWGRHGARSLPEPAGGYVCAAGGLQLIAIPAARVMDIPLRVGWHAH